MKLRVGRRNDWMMWQLDWPCRNRYRRQTPPSMMDWQGGRLRGRTTRRVSEEADRPQRPPPLRHRRLPPLPPHLSIPNRSIITRRRRVRISKWSPNRSRSTTTTLIATILDRLRLSLRRRWTLWITETKATPSLPSTLSSTPIILLLLAEGQTKCSLGTDTGLFFF